MGNPRNEISELHFGTFPDSVYFQCWKPNFKTEVCANSGCPTAAFFWDPRRRDSQIIGRSCDAAVDGKARVPLDFEMLDAKIAAVLKKRVSNSALPKKSQCRRA